jgi:hypothetical protein
MAQQDTVDFVTAFAIGAVLGVGATLLLRADPPTRTERVLRELRPIGKAAGKRMKRAKKDMRRGARAAGAAGDEVYAAGREALGEFSGQVADIIAAAREEIVEAARDGVREARRAARRVRR